MSALLDELDRIANDLLCRFDEQKPVLSFEEYLLRVEQEPARHCRDAVTYLRDAFDYFGRQERGEGEPSRFRLFDLPWLDEEEARSLRLVGQEQVQHEIYRALNNFVREGRANRLPLLHGPNGSAKSTVARALMLALEHYSQTDEGALYRFHWVFPTRQKTRGGIGFGDKPSAVGAGSYAHLAEEDIDARLMDETRDHPLLLLPSEYRRRLLSNLLPVEDRSRTSRWLWDGELSHKNRKVFDALFSSQGGALAEVLRHVRVERYTISRRYRVGAVTLGPELNVDARERQVTADRSLSALPTSLQAVALYEASGELIDAAGGLLEYSDLLKRPLEAFKYLQLTVETGEVALPNQNVSINCFMIGSANEQELSAFRSHPEFESFRGRLEFIRTPYLLNWKSEQEIYEAQVAAHLQVHVAPHATRVAAMFAVLSRLRQPEADRYERTVRELIRGLTVFEKMELYTEGRLPERLAGEKAKELRSLIPALKEEGQGHDAYEGATGASPREMRTVLLDAAQSEAWIGLSPFAVLEQLDELCTRASEFAWLGRQSTEGGYGDHEEFRSWLYRRLLVLIEDDFRRASGLVDESQYDELFSRYVQHLSAWAKGEKLRNPHTGVSEPPDEQLMREVETLLNAADEAEVARHGLMQRFAAWAIESPGKPLESSPVFSDMVTRLRDAAFATRRHALGGLVKRVLACLERGHEAPPSDPQQRAEAERVIETMIRTQGYARSSVADAAAQLLSSGLADA